MFRDSQCVFGNVRSKNLKIQQNRNTTYQDPTVPDNFKKYKKKHNPKINISWTLNKNNKKCVRCYRNISMSIIASFSTNTKNISKATIYSKICTAGNKNRN